MKLTLNRKGQCFSVTPPPNPPSPHPAPLLPLPLFPQQLPCSLPFPSFKFWRISVSPREKARTNHPSVAMRHRMLEYFRAQPAVPWIYTGQIGTFMRQTGLSPHRNLTQKVTQHHFDLFPVLTCRWWQECIPNFDTFSWKSSTYKLRHELEGGI